MKVIQATFGQDVMFAGRMSKVFRESEYITLTWCNGYLLMSAKNEEIVVFPSNINNLAIEPGTGTTGGKSGK